MFLTTRRLFIAILFIALFVMATREIADPDFWWHLRTGQFIVATRSIPHADIFSFTNAGRPWVAHEWLSQVFIYALFALGAYPALILAFAAIITLSFAFVYARLVGKASTNAQPYVAAFALLLAAVATAPTWGVRPQMLSLLLTSVFLYVLDHWAVIVNSAKQSPTPNWGIASSHKPLLAMTTSNAKLIWLLPPLMILWVNLHSGYALGLAVIAVYLVGEGAAALLHFSRFTFYVSRQLVTLFLVFMLCLAVVPLNPNGVAMYVYPFETLTSRAMQTYIQEWFSPDFHLVEFQPFAWLLLATLAAIALAGKRVSLTQTLLLAGSGYAALRSARNIPIFAIIAAPILAEQVWQMVQARWVSASVSTNNATNTCPGGRCQGKRMARGIVVLNWLLLCVVALAGGARVGMVISNQQNVERAKFPAAAVDFLQAQNMRGALYNSYGWGGYLIWRLYPQTRVFIDGRADVYGDAFIEDVFLKAYRGGADWHAPLDRYGVRVVLIEPDAPLAAQLARAAEWRQVYEDKQAVIYAR